MLFERPKFAILSNNALKIIAAIAMVCDHMGVILFPDAFFLRVIGRLSFPVFAFLIAEGAKYTKNKLKHFLTMAGFALVIQVVYYIAMESLEMSVMVTFTLSIIIIYALDAFKATIFKPQNALSLKILTALGFLASILLAIFMDIHFDLDYGLSGCLVPVFPALFTTPKCDDFPALFKKIDSIIPRILITSLGVLALSIDDGGVQYVSLLAIPLLLLYSGERGKLKMKYFFYVFYPLHLVLLYGIWMLMNT
jgi:hypothetical protein